MSSIPRIGGLLVVALVAFAYRPVFQRAKVLGLTRPRASIKNIHGGDTHLILPDTTQCEDLHYYEPSNELFAACEGMEMPWQRHSWFPALANFKDSNAAGYGSIYVIDPVMFNARRLTLTGFDEPFVTHGIDVITGDDPKTVFIFAVNHLPNEDYVPATAPQGVLSLKARSQVEIFRHVLGSDSAEHVRSVRHPLIRTPNDIFATSTKSFYVTNDHYYREGNLRFIEDLSFAWLAPWSDTVYVDITKLTSTNAEKGFKITTALKGMHNNNGMAHSSKARPDEILIGDAAGGIMTRVRPKPGSHELEVLEHIQFDSTIDNPSYYEDHYATAANNASGYVIAGCARAIDLADAVHNASVPVPVMVWHARTNGQDEKHSEWQHNLIFQDDGNMLKSASTAVLVGINPKTNKGKKQAWLYVTGFISDAVLATKINL